MSKETYLAYKDLKRQAIELILDAQEHVRNVEKLKDKIISLRVEHEKEIKELHARIKELNGI